VDEVVDTRPLAPLPAALDRPDVAVNLHGRGPESTRVLLATRPRRLLAFAHADVPASAGGPAWPADEHEVRRWCRLLGAYGIVADPDDLDLHLPPDRIPPPATQGATLIHPGATSRARQWPPARFAAVAAAEARAGRDVVITGGPHEVDLAGAVAQAAGLGPSASRAGSTSLLGLAGLVGAAGRVVCGDTGVAHLATALRTPSVVLFGPTAPAHWGPPPDRLRHRVLWAGRNGDPHGSVPDEGLLRIQVDEVLAALTAL
jgi:ADP-heptose:LPS heptosyltransferase